jgi:hypothetical protein
MAIKYGVQATKVLNTTPAARAEFSHWPVKAIFDTFALSADLAANDVIYMGAKIPKGARVIYVSMDSGDLDAQSAGALTVGWLASDDAVEAVDADGFMDTIDVHTAGKAQSDSGLLASAQPGKYKQFSAEVQPTITVSGETDATTGTVSLLILYI